MKLEFSLQIFEKKKSQISNFIKIRPMRSELFHADGRSDCHDEANSLSSQFRERA
jgi:hypothetical protein